ncbi:MAG TPA: polyprenyl synthetase family protein, partial [Smithella sp.]|nr:polyprenyl synthetase family protein [Smithella sp.]
ASANQVFGNSVSILVGDFLSFKAFTLMTGIGRMDILKLISEMGKVMSEGEVFQLTKRGDIRMQQKDYLNIIERKTAVLISASCAAGAILASTSQEKIHALARFGTLIGMAFQITDDILDYTAPSKRFGKSLGKDLEEGKITLPLLFTIKNCSEEEKQRIREIISGRKISQKHMREIIGLINKYDAIDASMAIAATYLKKAKSQLKIFRDGPEKEHLKTVAEYVITRKE